MTDKSVAVTDIMTDMTDMTDKPAAMTDILAQFVIPLLLCYNDSIPHRGGNAMTVLTGDTHRDFKRVGALCDKLQTTIADTLIILGDAGINYFGGTEDTALKHVLSKLPITLFCILLRSRSKMHYPEDFLIPKKAGKKQKTKPYR